MVTPEADLDSVSRKTPVTGKSTEHDGRNGEWAVRKMPWPHHEAGEKTDGARGSHVDCSVY